MPDTKKCPQCGTVLPDGVLAGLCPACLLRQDTVAAEPKFDDIPKPGPTPDLAALFPQLEILAELGRGGMGVVYKARQKQLDRIVALKVLPPDVASDPHFADRFLREARALAKLNHPNIVTVHEFGESGGLYYLIMEYVDGVNLRQLERTRRPTPAEALAIIPKICDALQYAHEEGVVHRDIKPENILVDKRGRVKIADFGLAKLLGKTASDYTLTGTNQAMGTPHYMAPEQMEKPLAVDHRADIYSLGVVLYEMLTGELPLGRFAPPSQKVQVDVRLDEIVLRSMEHDVERRYQHVSEVRTDVENVAQSSPSPAAPKQSRRRTLLVATAVMVTILLTVGLIAIGNRFFGKPAPASTGTPSAADSHLPDGLVAWWRGDGNALDSAGINHGTIENVTFEKGKFGKAFRITGSTNSFVSVPKSSVLSFGSNDFSIALWVKFCSPANLQVFLGSDDGGGDYNKWIFWVWDGRLQLHVNTEKVGGRYFGEGPFKPTTNQWYHVAVVNKGHRYSFYVDGNEIWSDLWLGNIPVTVAPLTIGKAEGFGFDGLLDDIRIYNRAISSNEIEALVNMPFPTAVWNPQEQIPYTYTTNNNAITITKYTGPGGAVTVPSTINGLPVTSIGDDAFIHRSDLTSVTIPNSVTNIGGVSFFNCNGLTNVTIPDSVTSIGDQAFNFCTSLTNIVIPKNVTSICTFGGCQRLNSIVVDAANPAYCSDVDGVLFNKDKSCVIGYPGGKVGGYVIPATVRSIGEGAFAECVNLKSVTIPNSVTNISSWAFAGCTKLTEVTIPASVTSIGINPFSSWSRSEFASISVEENNPAYSSQDAALFDKEKTCLIAYPCGKAGSYEIPKGVTKISESAFRGCAYLPSVTIPASVTSIGRETFWKCDSLTAIYFKGNAPWLDQDAFKDSSKVTIYYQPGTTGWGPEFGGRPTAPWNPPVK